MLWKDELLKEGRMFKVGKTFLGAGSEIQQDRPFKYNVCCLMEKKFDYGWQMGYRWCASSN